MKTITTEEYNLECLKAQWKSATPVDWLIYLSERLAKLKVEYAADKENTYYGNELLLLSKKLELVAKEMGGKSNVWSDPRN